jgi:putative glutamine amidotransferase
MLGDHPFHVAGKKYLDAVRLAGGLPLIVPSAEAEEIDTLLDLADGVFLTGSPSNVHPSHFGETVADPSLPLDPLRDSWTLPLTRKAISRGLPLFAVCRGAQETNVALGGTLHQTVHAIDGHLDHRAPEGQPVAAQYGPAHTVAVQPGGRLAEILGTASFSVNSLHGQAVGQLAPGLRLEAVAPDGVVEAFSVDASPGFALCVQWHPEWQAASNPQSMALLQAFGRALEVQRLRRVSLEKSSEEVPEAEGQPY